MTSASVLSVLAPLAVVAFSSVVIGLLVIAVVFLYKAIVDLRNRLDSLQGGSPQPAPAPTPAAAPVAPAAEAPVAPEIIAAIMAAVYVTLGQNQRLVSVSPLGVDPAWSLEGRRQVLGARKVR